MKLIINISLSGKVHKFFKLQRLPFKERDEKMALPRFVVLKATFNDKYLCYTNEDGPEHGLLRFSGNEASSPYAKFDSNGKQLVHIRCCFNNKYFVFRTPDDWWIAAGADEPEDDQSKWSCTLFEVLYVDGAIHPSIENVGQTIQLRHVQSGHYACLWKVPRPYDLCIFAYLTEFEQEWRDIYTFTDWESLSPSTPAEAFTRERMALPKFAVLKSNYNKYLQYIHESGPVHGFLQFSQEEVSSPYAKHELEMAKTSNGKRLVHIRCCYNNKYFVRGSANDMWIVASADKPEEDQSKWSCTLFEPLYVDDGAAQTIRFRHIQLGHYACLWKIATPPHDSCLFAGSPMPDKDQCDVYAIIDWDSPSILPPKDEVFTRETMALPRFAVLKSNFNDKNLRYIHEEDEGMQGHLQFSGEEVSSTYTKFEVEIAKTSINGKALVHIKCCFNNKYFVRQSPSQWWIKAMADEPEEDQPKWSCTLFEPLRVVDSGAAQTTIGSVAQTIRLRHIQLGHYAYLYRQRANFMRTSKDTDKEQRDVYTIIDWETLSLLQPKNEAFARETIPLPRFAVLKSNYNDKYLRYVHEEDGEMHGFVQFSGEEIVSPYTKYESEMAKSTRYGKGLVHIRCCYNNKYLVR
ncbi:unnamed protein product [Camellia sinensis]